MGIPGNEPADRAARLVASSQVVSFHLSPRLYLRKSRINSVVMRLEKSDLHLEEQGSRSAAWYAGVNRHESLNLAFDVNPRAVCHLHRLRLGYLVLLSSQEHLPDTCAHCLEVTEDPLLHYVLQCPVTHRLRHNIY